MHGWRWLVSKALVGPVVFGATLLGPVAAQSPSSRPMPGRFVVTPDSVRLWYRVLGAGRQTVLIPAGMYHRTAFDGLARGRRIVLFDPRGRGQADTVPMTKAGLDRSLSDIETIRKAVGADSIALVSWSALGLEGFVYALRYPGRLTRLVQLAPLPPRRLPFWNDILTTRGGKVDSAARARFEARVAAGEFAGKPAEHCRAIAALNDPVAFGDRKDAHLAPDVCGFPPEWPGYNGRFGKAMIESYGEWDYRPDLARVAIPRLVVHGDRDNFPLAGSREWVAGRPNARLLVFPGAGHWLQYERPGPLLLALDAFLRGQWPAGSEAVP